MQPILITVVAYTNSVFQERNIRKTWHQRVETLESLRPAVDGADQRELEIMPKRNRVRTGLQHVIPGGRAGEMLLNAIAKLRLDEQIITQPSQGIGRHRGRHLEILSALSIALHVRACPRDPFLRSHAEFGRTKREQHGCFERERGQLPLVGASERLFETMKAAALDQRFDIAGWRRCGRCGQRTGTRQ